ncbi:Pathogenesis-related protein 1 [Zea mays]|jgi:pathogenesis-related protein 1|uniref:Pathogenesis-related protein 1 n=1 Tax=Zea mays TaxID=4577 RepID=A0A3L6E5Q5_MAIZE|nr:Pathogenesis-related protein 1 [Zea mays]
MASSRKLAPLAVALATIALVVTVTPCAAQKSVEDDVVDLHNAARADVGVKSVSWNDSLATYAESYAETRQDDCQLKFSDGPYGENLFWGAAGTNWTAADVVGLWVAQKQYYDHASNTCAAGKKCGAYTQVVWRGTTSIGCAAVVCSNEGGVFAICSYNPPGNLDGQSPY